jgi:hypothetical protein
VSLDTATNLAPAITIDGASISPASGVTQNFAVLVPYTVTAADGSAAQWIVTVKWEPLAPANIAADIAAYFAGFPAGTGGSAADPIPLPVNINLASGWTALLTAIQTGGKYVALDLSACTGGAAEFDPGTANTGEDKIVSLILPDTATGIKVGTWDDPTFKHFTALKSVAGGAVTGVGEWAFGHCDALETVSLPAAATIGNIAFADCIALTAVSLPAATTIGNEAFAECTALETVSLPAAITIGNIAFADCIALETVSLPAAITIGDSPFYYCDALTAVSLPAAPTIGNGAFLYCTSLETVSLPAAATIGGTAFYGTGTEKALTVTLGAAPPELGPEMFYAVYDGTKSVTVKVPNNAAWSGKTGSFTGNNAAETWGNGFRGGGWDGTGMTDGSKINENISLTIQVQE